MIVSLLLVQLALCGVILYREVVQLQFRNLASSFFFALYMILFVAEPLVLHLCFGGAHTVSNLGGSVFTDPDVYYLLNAYGITLLLAYILLRRRGAATWERMMLPSATLAAEQPRGLASYLAVVIIAGVLLFIYSTGMNIRDLLVASRFAWFQENDFSLLWLTVASYFIALIAMYAYLLKTTAQRNKLLLVLCFAAIILHGVISKDRKWIIFLASGWIAGQYELSGRKLRVSRRAALAFAVVFILMVISQFIRDVMFRYALGEPVDFGEQVGLWGEQLVVYGDISYFYRASLEAIYQNIHNGVIIPFALARRILFFFLPVSWSGGLKVEDISATFSDIVDAGDAQRRGNMPPGLFGLFAISFGWFWSLLVIPLLAVLLRKLDAMFRYGTGRLRESVLSLYVFAALLAFRGDDSSATYYVVSTYLITSAWLIYRYVTSPRRGAAAGTDLHVTGRGAPERAKPS